MTLREYIIFWQETYDSHQSRPTTYAAHNYVFKNHILPGLGDIPLSELTSGGAAALRQSSTRQLWLGRRNHAAHPPPAPAMLGPSHTGRSPDGESCQGIPLPQVHNGESEYHDASGDGGLSGCRRAIGLPPHVHAGADDRPTPRRAHRPEME